MGMYIPLIYFLYFLSIREYVVLTELYWITLWPLLADSLEVNETGTG